MEERGMRNEEKWRTGFTMGTFVDGKKWHGKRSFSRKISEAAPWAKGSEKRRRRRRRRMQRGGREKEERPDESHQPRIRDVSHCAEFALLFAGEKGGESKTRPPGIGVISPLEFQPGERAGLKGGGKKGKAV
ncbi:hypothetical protein KM043_011924 [Ampulex compressa]|nr:hypothetical protein KM043_011924 [Ampulex compressa]